MFKKVLIANRGTVACRIIRTLKKMGITSVAVYAQADQQSLHVLEADESIFLGEGTAAKTYLDIDKIFAAIQDSGAEAVHPGYGFLSENAEFAEQCKDKGIAFLGPSAEHIRQFGLKHSARALAQENNVPLLPGTDLLESVDEALAEASIIAYPVMLKSTAGGGGIGMQLCYSADELAQAYESVKRLSQNNFNDAGIFLEKYVTQARHIEVQIFGDGQGEVVALGERDCSLQRRNQKVIEEAPAPGITDEVRQALFAAAIRLGKAVNYQSVGTVEYIYDNASAEFYFLEVNTRLQVEHGITEEITGVDLVEWMLRQAVGQRFLHEYQYQPQGVSVQARIYAENPAKAFQPATGLLTEVVLPLDTARCDYWVETGITVSPFYDPLLGKVIVKAPTREAALLALESALHESSIAGIETNLEYLQHIVTAKTFIEAQHNTRFLNDFDYQPLTVDVMQAGVQTTIQDWPGRTGYWHVGVPPSGPMDNYAHRLANRLLNNSESAAALELTLAGPTLHFNSNTFIAITGANMQAMLDNKPLPLWQCIPVAAGSVLTFGAIESGGASAGYRTYLAVAGGFNVPAYLASKSTFTLGQFGGHAGRALQVGDVLRLYAQDNKPLLVHQPLADELLPDYRNEWQIDVMYGPYGAPDYFTADDISMFFDTAWEVHYNSSRTGIRLIGPKPQWARSDGGEAGLHPSNIHDCAYAVGTIDFTGDMPIILASDGPSLGGFVCPATIIQADLWKMGQLKPGDTVRFNAVTADYAYRKRKALKEAIANLTPLACPKLASDKVQPLVSSTIVAAVPAEAGKPAMTCRQAGDAYLLIEFGEMVLDIDLRFRIHTLMLKLQDVQVAGVIELTPGVRSLQIHYDNEIVSQSALLDILLKLEGELPPTQQMQVPARIVHLPLAWDHPETRLAIEKYMQSVREDAPWCPSNIEFIRRINGLESIEAVKDIVFSANYLVMGLGDVYLGAPVATPLDPRHRLVTTKYNPARTWTPENAVGIGGSYLCVYGMEGPGGYQFVGRTLQMWNRFKQTADFVEGMPWLLRFFDQIRFYEVSEAELEQFRKDFINGRFKLQVSETVFSANDYQQFLQDNAESIQAFKAKQQAAFEAERERWAQQGIDEYIEEPDNTEAEQAAVTIPDGCVAEVSHVPGNCWSVEVSVGDQVNIGDPLLVIESMKMEIALKASHAGRVVEILCEPGQQLSIGQVLVVLQG